MRIAKCVTFSVVVALASLAALAVEAGQDNSAKPPQASLRQASGTRTASCVVQITADPTLVTLSPETVRGIIYSSGVVGKATREVLQRDLLGDAERLLQIEWLDISPAEPSPATRPMNESYDNEMMRELQKIYGEEYLKKYGLPGGRKGGTEEKQAPNPSPGDQTKASSNAENSPQSDAPYQPRMRGAAAPDSPYGHTTTGGYGGGIGGMGSMGRAMGGMGMGAYGSMGGMMGGVGGIGINMGGMGVVGGMMPGMGGYGGMGGMMGRAEQTAFVRLSVELPDDIVPVADEFLDAVVTNLEATLMKAYDNQVDRLRELLTRVEDQHRRVADAVHGETDDAAPSPQIREQLNTIVDLDLGPQMAVADAVEVLKRSVQPPLNIVVLWNDLRVAPTATCNIGGMVQVRLGTVLDLLVKGLLPGSDKPIWVIKDNVIVIGWPATLGQSKESAGKPKVETNAATLAAQKNELERSVQSLELELAGQEARRKAIEEQIQVARAMADEKLAQDPVTQELQKLVEIDTTNLATLRKLVDSGHLVPAELAKAEEGLTRAKIELAQRREELSKQVGGGQLEQFNNELARMAIDKAEKEMQQKVLRSQLQEVQQQLAQASVFDPQAARMRIAREALDMIARRIADLQMRLASLQPPTVNVIGAN